MEVEVRTTGKSVIPLLSVMMICCVSFADEASENKEFAKSKGCFECHGSTGNTGWDDTNPPVPKIAGQPKSYLIKSMNDYKTGARKDEKMNLIMSVRTDEDIERLAEYFSVQKRY